MLETVDDYERVLEQSIMHEVREAMADMVDAGASEVQARVRAERILYTLWDDLRRGVKWITAEEAAKRGGN